MPDSDDRESDLLLSQGRLTDRRRDEVFRNVLLAVSAAESPKARSVSWRWLWRGLATGALALGGVILFVGRPQSPPSEFRAKGVEMASSQPVASVECEGGQLTSCPAGARLLFRSFRDTGFLAAYAEPVAGGERVWYFEPDQPVSLSVNSHDSGYLRQSVLIGAEHARGEYRVHVLLLAAPASRAAILARTSQVLAEQTVPLVVR